MDVTNHDWCKKGCDIWDRSQKQKIILDGSVDQGIMDEHTGAWVGKVPYWNETLAKGIALS